MENRILLAVLVGVLLLVLAVVWHMRRRRKPEPIARESAQGPAPQATAAAEVTPAGDLSQRLGRTRGALLGSLTRFFSSPDASLQAEGWEGIEEALLAADVGVATSALLLDRVKLRAKEAGKPALQELIRQESERILQDALQASPPRASGEKPLVISIVGVNGVGKTTTIGKLAARFRQEGKSVLLGAGDTFRAAAIAQLRVWAERSGAEFVAGREGGDPGAVAFDAVSAGKARGLDIVLLDTAGRLHTKSNLMEELKKVHRVIKKVIPEAPHETWLVVDGTLGQNSVQQAREFQKALDLTGIVVTKLDGTAKGGAVLSVAAELKLPIRYIGVGESAQDLIPFEPAPFVDAILGQA